MFTILYPYRNREISRIKKSLDSLRAQTAQNFQVYFLDYGSDAAISHEVQSLLNEYTFAKYYYLPTRYQPWNKSKALNFGIKKIQTEYGFVADVDMIFHPQFSQELTRLKNPNQAVYFKVGFLSETESKKNQAFEAYQIKFYSNHEATGMTLFPISKAKEISGFDEFFHFWGAEDTDFHNRLKKANCEVFFYADKTLMLHQWHPNFNSQKSATLTASLQLSRIAEINHLHLLENERNPKNNHQNGWGVILDNDALLDKAADFKINITNEKKYIDYLLNGQLPLATNQLVEITIKKSQEPNTLKHQFKKAFGYKTKSFYNLKEVNDKILLQLLSFYSSKPYIYRVNTDLSGMLLKIEL
ncbi:glycosyltransferase [Flavobacterium sp. NST-5]|uniref:Glycosyltransferase n=1 Tax=Flavobacterium ichthyis TaxID=2698827 RepID=A0ABW9Z9P4_9FLAO|nr:galactosyltransferase-related protein [Flavobacterium ichthyis]NBL64835.1 glycosyltransferase [Flavobacterium ichthyis]